ncbi:MAG: biopolymer transporter ExbD [Planctomycetota bacterium]|nr:MAG: biopolymer transporter ExbD [Planctomycetota bacterium]
MSRRTSRRNSGPEHVSPNLTPLLDIVLQLITFFMMLVHFGSKVEESALIVKLPVAPAALPGDDPGMDRLVVSLDTTGRLVSGKEEVPPVEQPAWWMRQAGLRREGAELVALPVTQSLQTRVFVRGDRRLAYGRLRESLAQGQQAGFERFSLIVKRSEEE